MRVIVFGNNYQDIHAGRIAGLLSHLLASGITVSVERKFLSYLASCPCELPPGCSAVSCASAIDADVALSLGGDGTFLTTVMWVATQGIPIMGVNTGHLGYLSAYALEEAELIAGDLLNGNYTVERRSMLHAHCDRLHIEHPLALNEVAILRQDTSSMIEMETTLNGRPLTLYKGDGLVVCTPTGSTAYNLSAGGPILAPTTRCLALSPLSPHSLTMRPLVVPDDAEISIVTQTRSGAFRLSVDGEGFTCPAGARVNICRASTDVLVIQRTDHNFAHTLRHKLHWGFS